MILERVQFHGLSLINDDGDETAGFCVLQPSGVMLLGLSGAVFDGSIFSSSSSFSLRCNNYVCLCTIRTTIAVKLALFIRV